MLNDMIVARNELPKNRIYKQKEEKEQLYQALFENNPDAVYAIDLDGNFINGNPVCERLTGYKMEEMQGKSFAHLIVPEQMRKAYQAFKRAAAGERLEYETAIFHKSGQRLDVYVKNFPIIVDGQIVGVYGIARDITPINRKKIELRESEERYRLITENSLDLICRLSPDGIFLYASPACRTLLGYEPEEMVGRHAVDYLHPDDVDELTRLYQSSFPFKEAYTVTSRLRAKDGHYVWFETTGKSILNPRTGELEEFITVSRDITERMKTRELLQHSEKLTLVGQLAAGIAHEIRNPLTALKGFLQLMQKNGQEKKEYYSIMSSELARIELIVSELLVLAKPQSTYFQERDLHTLIKHVVTLIDTEAIIKNVLITVEFESDIPPIRCDENQLKQAFINFLKNGIEAMQNGGNIFIKVSRDEAHVIIRFIDQGCGIPEERIKRLGEPFYTTKETGTGLGLMVSYKIIENHNGQIRMTSKLNEGTTVEVILPIDRG
jgi:two-component system sporulation sensor kinase A